MLDPTSVLLKKQGIGHQQGWAKPKGQTPARGHLLWPPGVLMLGAWCPYRPFHGLIGLSLIASCLESSVMFNP